MLNNLAHMWGPWKTSYRSHTCVNSSLEYRLRRSHTWLRCTAVPYLHN